MHGETMKYPETLNGNVTLLCVMITPVLFKM